MKRLFGNGNEKEWEKPSGNPMEMGIGYKIGNGNGREWECKKRFPVITTDIRHWSKSVKYKKYRTSGLWTRI